MSILRDKKVIIIGDRDGISARTIEECVRKEPTAQVIYSATEFFSTAMDLETQTRIRELSDEYDRENLLVILGTAELDSTRLAAHTVTNGDPSGKGALTGVSLELPLIHALEDSFKEAAGEDSWDDYLKIFTKVFDSEAVVEALRSIRKPH